jgi:hypothetical protein
MIDEQHEKLIISFLIKNYPVVRVKEKNRFKRAILLDNGYYFLSDNNSALPLKKKLIDVLKIVFDCDSVYANNIISKSLNI